MWCDISRNVEKKVNMIRHYFYVHNLVAILVLKCHNKFF